jgi:iron(III)-salmochelin esterase
MGRTDHRAIRLPRPRQRGLRMLWFLLLLAACERPGDPAASQRNEPPGQLVLPVRHEQESRAAALTRGPTPSLDAGGEPGGPGTRLAAEELSWRFEKGPFGPSDVLISLPARLPHERFPVLVAFHGRGEALAGSRRGARGWFDDYELGRAIARLGQPPLSKGDFRDYVSDARLAQLNADLRQRPYAGLIVVCPYLPDVLKGATAFVEMEPLGRFIVEELLPRVYDRTPALGTPGSTGADGVSLGGRAALLVGLGRPLAFGSVGAVQAALGEQEIARFSELAARARAQNSQLALRLLTSDEDYFLAQNLALSAALSERGLPHQLTRAVGTHSYRFNRGPGGLEMLLFHDRALRGLLPL